ncbi:Toll/interleukin-1 receptor domain-containing protein [Tanacetum coccineum]
MSCGLWCLLEERTMSNSNMRGSCTYGARCKFVHGANDLRPRPSNVSAPQSRAATVPPNARTTPSHNNESQSNCTDSKSTLWNGPMWTLMSSPTTKPISFSQTNNSAGPHNFNYGISGPSHQFGCPIEAILLHEKITSGHYASSAFQTMTLQEPLGIWIWGITLTLP